MVFRFHSNQLSRATRGLASAVLAVAVVLIGFGALILALPAFFVLIAAGLFFLGGISCAIYAIKIFFAAHRMGRRMSNGQDAYRENVDIHYRGHLEE